MPFFRKVLVSVLVLVAVGCKPSSTEVDVVSIDTRPLVQVAPARTSLPASLLPAAATRPTCDAACARWVSVTLLRQALADNPPTGCASWNCDRGGIRWKRPCAIPEYICDRESNPWSDSVPGLIDVRNNSNGRAKGKYQFMDGTFAYGLRGQINEWRSTACPLCNLLADLAAPWVGTEERPRPASGAPEWVQDAAASWLYKREPGHWDCC